MNCQGPRLHRHDEPEHAAPPPSPEAQLQFGHAAAHAVTNSPLSAGEGRGKLLYFDAFSGAGGDMCVAALLDLGVPFELVQSAVAALALSGVAISVRPVNVGALGASKFEVHVEPGSQPQRSYRQIEELLRHAPLQAPVTELALKVFERLARAESQVHRVALPEVHFHEVGAADSIVDIVAAAAALSFLGAEVVCSPLPLGHGFVQSQHGRLPLPAPATVLCLQGLLTYDGGVEAELITPTAAALFGATARCERWPTLRPLRVGWGAGTRELADRPNVLRVVLGEARASAGQAASTHELVETNLDDVTGELLGHGLEQLLRAGALDAWVSPCTMKKGRPGWILSALCERGRAGLLAEVMMRETSSIGVRISELRRATLPRLVNVVNTQFGDVPVKFSAPDAQGLRHVKPEFDICRRLAEHHGVPVRTVLEAALQAANNVVRHTAEPVT